MDLLVSSHKPCQPQWERILFLPLFYTLYANKNRYYPLQIKGYDAKHIVLGRYGFEIRAVLKLDCRFNNVEYSAFVHNKAEGWKELTGDGLASNKRTLGQDFKGAYLVFLKPNSLHPRNRSKKVFFTT